MFGGAKTTFGTANTGSGFGNNTTTSSPLGQSMFGKPDTSTFGVPSLFVANTAQSQQSGPFGGASTATDKTTQTTFDLTQPQEKTSIFGATQPPANSSSIFGQPTATSDFGSTVKSADLGTFGQTAAPSTFSLFGQPDLFGSGFGKFGQSAAATTNVVGSTPFFTFGQPATAAKATNSGSSVAKYQPTIGKDAIMQDGHSRNVNTKQHCITAMKEYESKSLEELRLEDYMANRKGAQAGATGSFGGFGGFGVAAQPTVGTGLVGTNAQHRTGMFGQTSADSTENKSLLGSSESVFGQPISSLFGQPFASSGTIGFGTFGQTTPGTKNVFGIAPFSAFGQPTNASESANAGSSTAKYQPTIGEDIITKAKTKHHCISAMKEYESKSLEELRLEYYMANRKGNQAGAVGNFGGFGIEVKPYWTSGLFGATAQPATCIFGHPAVAPVKNKALLRSKKSAFAQRARAGLGMAAVPPFGAKPGLFGATAAEKSNSFGVKTVFGETASPFGQTPATSAAPTFGQTITGGFFGGFGTTAGQQQQQPLLFGQPAADANKPIFGFGQQSAGNTGFGGLGTAATGFGKEYGFGTAPKFGSTSQANTGFGNFSFNNLNLNKPGTSGFGNFGTQRAPTTSHNLNSGRAQPFIFGNNTAKPGNHFGSSLAQSSQPAAGCIFPQPGQSTFGQGNTIFLYCNISPPLSNSFSFFEEQFINFFHGLSLHAKK